MIKICAIVLGIIAAICFVIGILQLCEKGFLLNSAYTSKEKNKKPYYKQSGIVFLLVGLIFLFNTINLLIKSTRLFYVVISIIIITFVFVAVSAIKMKK